INEGFGNVHKRLDEFHKECADRHVVCINRFTEIETAETVRKALNGAAKEEKDKAIDVWKYLIRGAAVTGGTGAVIWIILMIIQHIDLVARAVGR
ncbi:MAG: hypothetical protein PHN75_18635, partial [Syntrophales bacterium]|nr:hypothetical protein [Syntrophales bacterium]